MMVTVGYIFPGQGSQSVGMGKEFYDVSPQAREVFDGAEKLVPGLKQVIFEGPSEKLTSTAFCQPAIFTFSIAALRALQAHPKGKELKPEFACGLSLGECTALVASAALTFPQGLKLVERRSFFMEEATRVEKGAMAAVIGFDKDKLIELCLETECEVANFNSPDQTVITGRAVNVEDACRLIKEHGAKRVIPLDVSGAFHSSLMKPAVPQFEKFLKTVHFQVPQFPIISNVDAQPENNPEYIRRNLALQITSSVKWVDTVRAMSAASVKNFIEIGPGAVLKGLVRKINPELKVYNVQKPEDLENLPV